MLQGYKTYIMAFCVVIITGLHSLNKINDTTYQTLLAVFGSGATAALAAKVNRVNDKLK